MSSNIATACKTAGVLPVERGGTAEVIFTAHFLEERGRPSSITKVVIDVDFDQTFGLRTMVSVRPEPLLSQTCAQRTDDEKQRSWHTRLDLWNPTKKQHR